MSWFCGLVRNWDCILRICACIVTTLTFSSFRFHPSSVVLFDERCSVDCISLLPIVNKYFLLALPFLAASFFIPNIVVHFEFLDLSEFLRPHQTGSTTQLPSETPSGTWRKIRHALPGNRAHTYARTPLKWGSQNYTLCSCCSGHDFRESIAITFASSKVKDA